MEINIRNKKKTAAFMCLILCVSCLNLTSCGSQPAGGQNEPEQNISEQSDAAQSDAADTASGPADDAQTDSTQTGDAQTDGTQTGDAQADEVSTAKLSDGITIPEINVPSLKVPDSEYIDFLQAMGVGYNLGNTFDAYSDPTPGDEMSTETCWGNPVTTEQMIRDIHAYGFDTIRIPVSWHNHVDADVNISEQWLARVNEVVDWAIDDGMYVIINIHHDNHPEANGLYPDKAHMDQSKKYVSRIWEQVSARFADYDEHLIFEAMNEPRLVGTDHEWYIEDGNAECREAIECINELNQLFVDTVRASGGNNSTRYLMCPGYCASVEGGTNPFYELPTDTEGNESKIILSVHAYTPYNFALEYPGVKDFDVDNKERTTDINNFMNRLYMDYVTQGIPVVIGEFGSRDKGGNLQDRVNFSAYFVAMSRARNIPCAVWDNGAFDGDGEIFGLYDRRNPSDSVTDIISALMQYK